MCVDRILVKRNRAEPLVTRRMVVVVVVVALQSVLPASFSSFDNILARPHQRETKIRFLRRCLLAKPFPSRNERPVLSTSVEKDRAIVARHSCYRYSWRLHYYYWRFP